MCFSSSALDQVFAEFLRFIHDENFCEAQRADAEPCRQGHMTMNETQHGATRAPCCVVESRFACSGRNDLLSHEAIGIRRRACREWRTSIGTPVVSSENSLPPSMMRLISPTRSCVLPLTLWVAPSSRASVRRLSCRSTAMMFLQTVGAQSGSDCNGHSGRMTAPYGRLLSCEAPLGSGSGQYCCVVLT